jgi:CheY-like chemotaxis protein
VRPAGPEADAALPDKIAPSKTILIIDDEEASRYIARHLFRNARYRIVESADGIEGAERARFEKPDLIFLDLMMPTRSGFEVLDDLKSDDSSRHIPVVIHTSKRLSENDLARLAARHAVVLPKSGKQRLEALCAIRRILSDPDLFAEEPEFAGPAKRGV